VGEGALPPSAEEGDELAVDAPALPLHIGGVDEEFVAGRGEGVEGRGVHGEIGEGLPSVHRHDPGVAATAATQIDDEAVASGLGGEAVEASGLEAAFAVE